MEQIFTRKIFAERKPNMIDTEKSLTGISWFIYSAGSGRSGGKEKKNLIFSIFLIRIHPME